MYIIYNVHFKMTEKKKKKDSLAGVIVDQRTRGRELRMLSDITGGHVIVNCTCPNIHDLPAGAVITNAGH